MRTERFEMRLDREMLERLDSWRSARSGIPSRSEAVRQLVERGLAASGRTRDRMSSGEKLIFWVLRDLHARAKGEAVDGLDIDFIKDALELGHEWAIDWEYPGIFEGRPPTSHETVREVCEVLNMWTFIERSHAKLSKEEERKVEAEAKPFGRDVRFIGFSVNDEIEHYSIAKFLITRMGRFASFKGRELNSHYPCLGSYRRMLVVFKPLLDSLTGRDDLSVSEIIDLLKEQTHPDNRKT